MEEYVRLICFFGILVLVALVEWVFPKRVLTHRRRTRWPSNLGLVVLNTILVRLLLPISAMGAAEFALERGWGLLAVLGLGKIVWVLLSFVMLDFFIYAQHLVFHRVPILWRIHRMHHTDLEYDVTTGLRFHPIEIWLSMVIKIALIFAFGFHPLGVLIFEIVLNGAAMFNHGNFRIPVSIDRILRWIIVTPDMHRVHHSVLSSEHHRNFGFNLPFWDRLFSTYTAQPNAGHQGMQIGLNIFNDVKYLRIDRLLMIPFLIPPNSDK